MQKTYEIPTLIISNDIAEGVFMLSGPKIDRNYSYTNYKKSVFIVSGENLTKNMVYEYIIQTAGHINSLHAYGTYSGFTYDWVPGSTTLKLTITDSNINGQFMINSNKDVTGLELSTSYSN